MKVYTTNYQNTFIEVADDCPVQVGEVPPSNESAKSIAAIQFEIVKQNPYTFTSDDVFFQVYADRNNLNQDEYQQARDQFFSKGQPCFRASPLTKRYGWGVHSNVEGKVALYGCDTDDYKKFLKDPALKVVKAMRSSKKN